MLHTNDGKQCPVVSSMKHIIVEIQIQACADIENHGLQPLGSLYRLGLGIWAMKPQTHIASKHMFQSSCQQKWKTLAANMLTQPYLANICPVDNHSCIAIETI